jgi:hypothetical protein
MPGVHGTRRDNDIDLEPHQIGRKFIEAIEFSLGIFFLDEDVLSLRVSELAQTLSQSLDASRVCGRGSST